jgi:hypothetical protein
MMLPVPLPRPWMIATGGALLVLLALAIFIVLWGNARYKAGESAADARWQEASARLERQARRSASAADQRAAQTIASHNERVATEKEKIDEAVNAGRSPFDALFD